MKYATIWMVEIMTQSSYAVQSNTISNRKPLYDSVCLFVLGFSSHSRIFHSYRDITMAGEGLQILTCAQHSWPLSSKGSLACHTYWDTWHPFLMINRGLTLVVKLYIILNVFKNNRYQVKLFALAFQFTETLRWGQTESMVNRTRLLNNAQSRNITCCWIRALFDSADDNDFSQSIRINYLTWQFNSALHLLLSILHWRALSY